jgi:hypothetical protein
VPLEDQGPANIFLLNTKGMARDKALYNAYLKSVSHPEPAISEARYLGAVMPTGDRDAFPVNYTGAIPPARAPFHSAMTVPSLLGVELWNTSREASAPAHLRAEHIRP